jgi:hypothetical protein
MTAITTPLPLFADADGSPLDSGYIYIGTAGQNPETAPISIYWDSALTQPAPQPLRTLRGQVSRNGAAAQVYVASDYSLTVRSKNGVLLLYQQSAADMNLGLQIINIYADLASSASNKGSGLVGFSQAATYGAGTLGKAIKDRAACVTDAPYLADNTGATSALAAFQAASNASRSIYVPSGTYKLDNRWLITNAGTIIWLAPNVTLNVSGWAYPGSQTPFGNQIHFTAGGCAIYGSGATSVVQLTGGSQANGIGLLHASGLWVYNLVLDGGKAGVTAIADDTFESGISVVCSAGGGAPGDAKAIIERCEIRNWCQYGVNVYGDKTAGTKVINCDVHDNGKTGDALSVGAGIVATRAVSDFTVHASRVYGNKNKGIFYSSAGQTAYGVTITDNQVHGNGFDGIAVTEELNYGCVAGQGTYDITITGNQCRANGRHGILMGTYDSVGFLRGAIVENNQCRDNVNYGILLATNATSSQALREFGVQGNVCVGNNIGVGLSAGLTDGIVSGNTVMRNTVTDLSDSASGPTSNISVGINLVGTSAPVLQSGAFTPAIIGSTTAGVTTYTTRTGWFWRVGEMVHYVIEATWSGQTGTGNLRVSSMPFAAAAGEPFSAVWVFANNLTATGQATFAPAAGQTYGDMGVINNGAYNTLAIDTAASIRITGSYRAAA